jgi:penicillin-binding protein 2
VDTVPIIIKEDSENNGNKSKIEFQFKNVPSEELDKFKVKLGLNYDATVDNCIKALAVNYKIDLEKYDLLSVRKIGGVRYEMEAKDFSFENRYVFAEGLSMDVIIELKERSSVLKGVDVVEEATRLYLDSTAIPHLRGRTNAINREQYELLKDSGYNLDDVIGFFGLEESQEYRLRGENGTRTTTRDASWEVISVETTKNAVAGNSLKLTVDTEFQRTIERIFEDHINWSNQPGNNPRKKGYTKTTAGSIVVLEVKTGRILAMANYPSYDLEDYVDLMLADAAGEPLLELQPLLDRSAGHGYRPGSCFKTVTCTSGLINGVVKRDTSIRCGGRYTYYKDYQPNCHVYPRAHGSLNSINALYNSCNCYFYDVGRQLGIERLSGTAKQFGVGTDLDCDVKMFPGIMTTPESKEEMTQLPFTYGDTIQAAIGQSETLLTPLHMATIAMTIANDGIRYRPYLVDSVWNYDYSELIEQIQPQIAEDLSVNEDGSSNEASFKAVKDGMHTLGLKQGTGIYNYLPEKPAFKTGTPEIIPGKLYNSTVLGFYPFDEPQIAFSIVLEGGEYSSRAIRNVIDAYFYDHYEPVIDDKGNVKYDWVRWTGPRETVR